MYEPELQRTMPDYAGYLLFHGTDGGQLYISRTPVKGRRFQPLFRLRKAGSSRISVRKAFIPYGPVLICHPGPVSLGLVYGATGPEVYRCVCCM